ncbi:MAG: recombination factor protein RarA [Oleiphilus sp.]|nr:MAG: recombination factor protein RarA [Oleiphilus sp.]
MQSLFDDINQEQAAYQPLAARVRPENLSEYIGQKHLLGEGSALSSALQKGALHSMVLWGPPGVGKTTFAHLLATTFDVNFRSLSAVLSGVKDIRAAVEEAKLLKQQGGRQTLLFVDEVHRFNKAQQDAFLPYVEDGSIVFVGATTENPSFELNNALLSRSRVYVLKRLEEEELLQVIEQALAHPDAFPDQQVCCTEESASLLAKASDGDARRCLNLLELAVDLGDRQGNTVNVGKAQIEDVLQQSLKRFDKGGDIFYEQISALHKSVRGSDPDAALYWFVRMIDGGCDPLYIARRLVRMASEDIGNADPRALTLTLSAWDVQERLGSPEGELSLAHAVVYLAVAPKSNAVYSAFNQCRQLVRDGADLDVPMHLRNAPTTLMADQGMGEGYRYAHDEPQAFAAGECYFPEELADTTLYHPVDRGLEIRIGEKLRHLREANRAATQKRYR